MRFFLIFHFLLLIFHFLPPKLVQAQTRSAPASFAPKQVDSGQPRCPNPITDNTISQTQLTKPSLWWAEDRFGGLLLDSWFGCPNERRVYLVVNRQIWTSLNYIERYEFVNHFATYVRPNNYNVVVLNPQQRPLATYICNYSVNPADCNVWIDITGTSSFQRQLIQR